MPEPPPDAVPVARGVTLSRDGAVTVEPDLTETLLDLAEELEARTGHPVDVEHVLAAVVLAGRRGSIPPDRQLRPHDDLLLAALAPHVETVFTTYGGVVSDEDAEE